MKRYNRELTAKPLDEATKARHKRLLSMGDEDIDYSDIPPTDEKFWARAELVIPSNVAGKPSKKDS